MSRLTKTVKETIAFNWKEEKHKNIEQVLTDEFNAELKVVFEKEFKEKILIAENNKDILMYMCTHNHFESNSYELLGFIGGYKNISCARYVSTSHYSSSSVSRGNKEYKKLIKKYQDIWSKYTAEVKSIRSVMDSVTTIKRLIDLLPEIEKYVPAQSNVTTLVASGDLVKAKSVL